MNSFCSSWTVFVFRTRSSTWFK